MGVDPSQAKTTFVKKRVKKFGGISFLSYLCGRNKTKGILRRKQYGWVVSEYVTGHP